MEESIQTKCVQTSEKRVKKKCYLLPNRCILPIFLSKTHWFHMFHAVDDQKMPIIFGASCPSCRFLCLSRKFHMKSSAETNTIGIVRKLCFFCQCWACAFKLSFLRTSFIMYIKSQETVKTSPLSHKADVRGEALSSTEARPFL